jgi:hypothetical protein
MQGNNKDKVVVKWKAEMHLVLDSPIIRTKLLC